MRTELFKVTLLSGLITFLLIALVHSHVTMLGGAKGLNEGDPIAMLVFDSPDIDSMRQSIDLIKELGVDVTHTYPPHILIGHIPENISQDLIGQANIPEIYYGFMDPSTVEKYGKAAVHAVEAWNNNFVGLASERGLAPEPGEPEPSPLIGDALLPPEPELLKQVGPQGAPLGAPYGAGFYDTSEYMIGSVAVGIILPESNGAIDPNTESWTSTEESNVISELQAGLNWWATKEPNAGLSFTYDIHYRVPTSYEPITRPSSDESLWINEVMTYLGYMTGDYFYKVWSYLNDLRASGGTDWAVAIFVVDDTNDADKKFADDYFAYAYLGGPFIVMTYGNDGYGISNMDAVTAHEFGHSFYALDEYSGSPDGSLSSGYENAPNLNHVDLGPGVSCIMRGQVSPYTAGAICTWTRGQVGWWNDDGDNILNILDTFPETSFVMIPPSPTSDDTLTFTGFAQVVPLPNRNPYGMGNDITLTNIANVQYRVDGGSWIDATAVDGAFDNHEESFTFTTSSLANGTYTIDARAINSVNNADPTYAGASITIENIPPIPRAPIYIDGDDNFTGANGVTSGSGTENDPYIIENLNISAENANGIEIRNTTAHFIIRNSYVHDGMGNGYDGIRFENVVNGRIGNVKSDNNYRGINFSSSNNNIILNSAFENNSYGIRLVGSENNRIHHNNLMNNENQAHDNGVNYWDDGYPSGGNYWSDYAGADNYWGENQNIPGSDGIGDTPYDIPLGANQDHYPLINPVSRGVEVSISPGYQSGPPGATLAYTVTVTNTGNVVDDYALSVGDNAGWGPSVSPESLLVLPGASDNATLSVTVPENAVPSTEDNITVTATSQTDNTVSDNDLCMAHVLSPKAEFSLATLYKVSLDVNLYLDNGSELVAKFYTYAGAYQGENVIWIGSTPAHVVLLKDIPHPMGKAVEKVELVLTDAEGTTISTFSTFTIRRVTLEVRFTEIPLEWTLAAPAERVELEIEFVEIPMHWALATS